MGDGITGLNPGKARTDIENINAGVTQVQKTFVVDSEKFNEELGKLWYSPRALEFDEVVVPMMEEINNKIIEFNEDTVSRCVGAYNRIAPAHGESQISIASGPYMTASYAKLQEISPSGVVGMEVDKVKTCVSEYISKMNALANDLPNLPDTIAFYDTDGSLANSCKTNIQKLRDSIGDYSETIIEKVSVCIAEEVMKVEQGRANAQDALSGTSV